MNFTELCLLAAIDYNLCLLSAKEDLSKNEVEKLILLDEAQKFILVNNFTQNMGYHNNETLH